MKKLFTIGYEGAVIEDFIASLIAVGVEVLIDVRDIPLSRKRGFSKRALAGNIEGVGIEYRHLVELGDPKPGRDAAKRGDFSEFARIYKKHLTRREAQEALKETLGVALSAKACLLCYERDPLECTLG
jgi:uncharacterized protein (DUF488 family)